MIKLIIFDSSGVVVNGGYTVTCKEIKKRFGIPYKRALAIFHDKYFVEACNKKQSSLISWQKAIDYFGLKVTAKKLEDLHLKLHQANPEVMKIAKELRGKYKVVLLSNNYQKYIDYIIKKFKYNKIFNEVINSQKIGLKKTNPEMFKYVLKRYKVKGEEAVYIDDIEKYLKISGKLGIHGLHYKNPNQFKKELNHLLKPMIKLIIFDCYGLVLNEGYPLTAKAYAKKFGGRWQDYYEIFYKKYFNLAATCQISQKQAWIEPVKHFNLPISWQEAREIHYKLMKLDKRVVKLNQELSKKGFKTLLLSKNTRSQFADTCRRFGFRKKFKNIINTWELGLPKASKKTLNLILKRFKVKPEEVVYADDQMANLVDAKEIGIKTILVKNYNQFKQELYRYLN